jgi:anti-sigma regulatory factor (Ser/Thr protein kinase)
MPMRYPLVSQMTPLGALKTAPGCARAHLRRTLSEWDMTAYDEVAELLTSELVTNAVLASTDEQGHPVYINGHLPFVIFRMIANRDGLVLEAWDLVPTPPVMRQVGAWDESGRGLLLVDTLSQRWDGKALLGWPGKCVWAEIRR